MTLTRLSVVREARTGTRAQEDAGGERMECVPDIGKVFEAAKMEEEGMRCKSATMMEVGEDATSE